MISRWKWMLKQTIKKLWFRATLFAIVAIITALLSILFKSMIPESVSVKVGAEAVDNILNILASSMLAVTTFSLSIMVSKLLTNDPRHVYLVAQPGSFIHPSMPVLYLSQGQESSINTDLLETIIVSDARSFAQDPRFCLSVMAEIACRALSPAVNDPGTAIDVIGRGVRILSTYAQNKSDEIEVKYPSVHVAPLQNNDLLEDFFSPVARDGASMREIQIRVLKGLSMLSKG
ncbi:DUF2254 family protein, partial [Escherichia coli]|nr:DUF2254 family protein [Escherichia coli]